jgi:cell division protein ZapA (FtsZ GTPase activity inhibitor)
MERKLLKIKVEIAEKPYRLTIAADEEEIVRRAALRIKTEIASLRKRHDASLADYLAMAALRIAIENEEQREQHVSSPQALRLKSLTSQLDKWLEEEQHSEEE